MELAIALLAAMALAWLMIRLTRPDNGRCPDCGRRLRQGRSICDDCNDARQW